MSPSPNPLFPSDEILTSEFNYIANTAFQSNEDRARATSFYLVTFGSFIAALVSAQLELGRQQEPWLDWGFFGLFLMLALMGLITTLELARLRVAWFESLAAMNAIKEFYIERHPELAQAIIWRSASDAMPARFKLTSVGFLMALQVAGLGGAALGAAAFFLAKAASDTVWVLPSLAVGVVYCLALLEGYRLTLK